MDKQLRDYWPGWETVRLIGQGSFGAVYEIQREIRGRTEHAALKVISIPQNESEIRELRTEEYDDESITQYFADSLGKIEEEYAMMAELKGHSNVVYCDDIRTVQHDNGFGWDIYIKMELLTPLKSYPRDKITDAQVIKLGMDICDALKLCEDLNIVHRDIKPENIFVSRNGNYKLGDFGIAKTMEGTTGGTKTGTYDYMSPEVYNNLPYHTQTDIYSLGLVMYWLLNNWTTPFLPTKGKKTTPSEKSIARDRRFSGEQIPAPKNGSNELKRIVLKACAFDPKDRYQTAREMREDLVRLSGGQAAEYIHEPKVIPAPDVQDEIGESKTVGPVFDYRHAVDQDNLNKTVGPDFSSKLTKTKGKPERKREPKSKIVSVIALAFICISCVGASLPAMLSNNKTIDNVLMADEITFDKDSEGNYLTKPVFGSEIMRNQIKTITFLDSMKETPETAWDVSELQNGTVMAWVESNGNLYDLYIAGDGGVRAPENSYGLFALYENVVFLDFNGSFSTNQVSNMRSMFYNCKTLSALDVSNFDTSSVTNMVCMFRGCEGISELDVSGFDTSNVTDMRAMFALCKALESIDVSSFNTEKVDNMASMFNQCMLLKSIDLGAFDTSNVKRMDRMFYWCNAARTINVSGFDTSQVTDMHEMFEACNTVTTIDVSGFDTSQVTDMTGMFNNCHALYSLDLTSFDTHNVTSMKNMFLACKSLEHLDVSGFNTSNVTDMHAMFCFCSFLTDLDVSGFKTQLVTDMGYMFRGCASLGSLDVSNFNTSNATNMKNMFRECESLVHLDVTGFDTKNVMDMSGMFYGCNGLFIWNVDKQYYEPLSLSIDNWDLRNVESFEQFAYGGIYGVYFNEQPWIDFFS